MQMNDAEASVKKYDDETGGIGTLAFLFIGGAAFFACIAWDARFSEGSISDASFYVRLALCFLALLCGASLLALIPKRRRFLLTFRRYAAAISRHPAGSLAELSASLGEDPEELERNLKKMIEAKFFTAAYIDKASGRLIVGQETQPSVIPPYVPKVPGAPVTVAIKCRRCGAVNSIIQGQVVPCEFCGEPLEGRRHF
jgi:hypothetical protein